jgi:hypothetical protein
MDTALNIKGVFYQDIKLERIFNFFNILLDKIRRLGNIGKESRNLGPKSMALGKGELY